MKAQIQAYNDIIHKVKFFYKNLKMNELENTKGRKLALKIETIISLGIFKQTHGIETKKAVYDIFQPNCSYKTFVVNLNRFAELAGIILVWMIHINKQSAHPVKYTDSTDIPVCRGKNALNHKTMKEFASWGGTSQGTFYGIKLHMTCDYHRKILSIRFARANVGERKVFMKLNSDLDGIVITDGGYLSLALQREFYQEGKRLMIFKPRKNMNKLMTRFEQWLYDGRMQIEFNFRNLKMFFNLVTSLPRSAGGYFANYIYSLLAYSLV